MSEEILRVEDLTKIYPGGVLANYKVNFSIDRGEIHALVGENGAGKSTLMKMLFGIEEITSGKVFLNGKEVHFRSSTDAIRAGIGMVHQHMMLVPSLTVAENLVLGIEQKRGLFLDRKKAIQETEEISMPSPKARSPSSAPSPSSRQATKPSTVAGVNARQRKPLPPIRFDSCDPVAMKRARNTEAARKSRARKLERQDVMERRIAELEKSLEEAEQREQYWKAMAQAQTQV